MFKKRLEKAAKIILVACIGVLLYSCTPEDGKDGTSGITGPAGANGSNGTNGSNGVGFEELTKYGTITTTLSGKTPSGKAFNQTDVFKFTPVNADGSSVYKDANFLRFDLSRSVDVQIPNGNTTGFYMDFYTYNKGTEQERKEFYTGFNSLAIKLDNLTFFNFNGYFDNVEGEDNNIPVVNVTEYSYDDTTKKLKFSFSYTVAADKNETKNILTVSGKVDVLVLEEEGDK
jgi:hypothetical protein